MRLRKNNTGFTLLELLLGVAILTIISVPLIRLFVTSSNTIYRSSHMGNATLAAENVVEQAEIMDFSQWISTETAPVIRNADGSDVQGRFIAEDYSELSSFPSDTPYFIAFDNISAGTSSYNTVLKLDPDSDGYEEINAKPMVEQVPTENNYSQSRDPVNDPDNVSWEAFLSSAASYGYNTASFERDNIDATKETIIDIKENAGNLTAEIAFIYEYKMPSSSEVDSSVHGEIFTFDTTTFANSILPITGVSVSEELGYPTLNISFFPWYYSKELITINNLDNSPVDIVLTKKIDTSLTESELTSAEFAYRAEVILKQSSTPDTTAKVMSNIKNSLTSLAVIAPGNVTYRIYTGSMISRDSEFAEGNSVTQGEAYDRLYHVTVEVFEMNEDGTSDYTTEPLFSFKTTNLQ